MKTIQKAKNVRKKFSTLPFLGMGRGRGFSILLLLAVILASCGNKTKTGDTTGEANAVAQSEQKAPQEKKLPFERGSYVEESSMMGFDVKKTVYFDRWGDWMATEDKSEMTIMGHTIKNDKLQIVKGSTHWDLDLIEKTGTTYELNIPPGLAAALGTALGGAMMEGTEIKELGEEEYMGYKCKKTQVKYAQMNMEATTLTYGNLTMKMEGTMGKSKISTKITSIDLSAPPASIFEVPSDVVIQKN